MFIGEGNDTLTIETIRRNTKKISRELQPDTHRPEESLIFCFDRQLILVSYVPKESHAEFFLSSFYYDQTTVGEEKKKPEIVLYYNNTKGDADHMVQTYFCKRKTKQWPITLFSNIFDVSTLATFVVWITKKSQWNGKKSYCRCVFLMKLGYDLVQSYLDRRRH